MQTCEWRETRSPQVLSAGKGGALEQNVGGPRDAELQRSDGAVRIVLDTRDTRTRVARVFQRYPLRVMFPLVDGGGVEEAVLVNASGGVAGGDCLEFAVAALGNSAIAVTSQAAERIYRALSAPARISTRLTVTETARLAWLPQETIVFDRARFSRKTAIDLASGAELLALEWLVLGRTAHGEKLVGGHIEDSWCVTIDGRLRWVDSFRVTDESFQHLHRGALLSGSKAIGTLVCFGPRLERRVEFLRNLAPWTGCGFAVTQVGGLLVARFAADRPSDLRRALRRLLQEFDREFGPGPYRVPKMWSC